MKSTKHSHALNWITYLLIAVTLCMGVIITDRAKAHPSRDMARKVSSELRRQARRSLSAGERTTVILQFQDSIRRGLKIKSDDDDNDGIDESVTLRRYLRQHRAHVTSRFRNLRMLVVEMPISAVAGLGDFDEVKYVSEDPNIKSSGHITSTSGVDMVRNQTVTTTPTAPVGTSGPLSLTLALTQTTTSTTQVGTMTTTSTTTTLGGQGVGIAVVDSGVYAAHKSFNNSSGQSRVIHSQDFTGEGRTDDPYGHGTHVASIAAGNGQIASGAYRGVAHNANLINLRVLGSNGTGKVSSLLNAIDWIMTNHAAYNIRVVNMSLGTPAIESYTIDPLCRAVRGLVDAGMVVVAAAGNNGKSGSGQKVYGQIHSPGNEPSALTVGATNTYGTNSRNDDVIASYSSRGPTRSFWTDVANVKHYDHLMKPDLVAPGN
nr:S8 family serine peptidase [Pyrinomonadaceae bacterium]